MMITKYTNIDMHATEIAKSRTLAALFQVICADNEFTLLRKTLELYCEEIAECELVTDDMDVSCA